MKNEQRRTEKVFVWIYTVFSAAMAFGILSCRTGEGAAAVLMPVGLCLAGGWMLFLRQYRDYKTRAYLYAAAMLICYWCYASCANAYYVVLPPFLVVVAALGLFKISRLIWFQTIVFFAVTLWHFAVLHTLRISSRQEFMRLAGQVACVLAVEYLRWNFIRIDIEMEQRLRRTIATLEEMEHSKDEFMANVSHEIRTPLNTVCGMSELALREELPAQVREEVFQIQTAGRALQSLVSDVLDYSELETGRVSLHEEPYIFSSVMNDVINMALAQKEEKCLELIVDCDARIPRVMVGDSEKLSRMISCLVGNAIKFTERGCVAVIVRARKERYGVNLCVQVKDTGIGMTQEQTESLFCSFNQVDTKKNRSKSGIGLGLAITRHTAELMGGFLKVSSRQGAGSEFRLVIPQRVEDERPLFVVKDAQQIRVGLYIDTEKYSISEIRDNYMAVISNMAEQLQVNLTQCRSLPELRRKTERNAFTHVMIAIDEYREDPSYFDALSMRMPVVLVLDRTDDAEVGGNFRRLYKPFYALSVTNILNGRNLTQRRDGSHYLEQRFTAPDASVLVVDDSAMNLKVMEGLLRPYGLHLFTAMSGEEALRMLEWAQYDLIFMDHMMPRMDGVETLHRIRKKSRKYCQTVPVVALTANAIGGAREMFLSEGFFDFVAKPIEVANLERVLRKYLPPEMILERGAQAEEEPAPGAQVPAQKGEASGAKACAEGAKACAEEEPADEKNRIDLEQGILYCGGEMEDYLAVSAVYCSTMPDKCSQMRQLLSERNWKEYTVLVHALKSTSLAIGAAVLSEMAKRQEEAGKEAREDVLLANHEALMQEYELVCAEIRRRWGDGA